MDQLNQAISLYPRFLPALIEKIKLHAALKEFEELVETAYRALVLDKHCLEPQRFLVIYNLAWENNEEAVSHLLRLLLLLIIIASFFFSGCTGFITFTRFDICS